MPKTFTSKNEFGFDEKSALSLSLAQGTTDSPIAQLKTMTVFTEPATENLLPTQYWPDEFVKEYRRAGYWNDETIPSILENRASEFGGKTAIVDGENRLSYEGLFQDVVQCAHWLKSIGLCAADRVLIQIGNTTDFYVTVFGCMHADLIPVLSLPAHRLTEISHLAKQSGARAYIGEMASAACITPDFPQRLKIDASTIDYVFSPLAARALYSRAYQLIDRNQWNPTRSANDVALLQISGGSTGLPKLIPRTHADYIYSFRASNKICGLDESSVYLVVLPAAHNFPMSSPGAFGAIYGGAKIVLTNSTIVGNAFDLIEQEQVTHVGLVPPLALMWAQSAELSANKLHSLKVLQVGGAKLLPEGARRIKKAIPAQLQQVFGMAEGLVNYTRLDDPQEIIINTQGRPISPADEIRVVDDNGEDVPNGTVGNLWTRGPYTVRSYFNDDNANRKAFTSDGFYKTGDLVLRRTDGYVEVHGRSDDAINRAGEKISCAEIEDHLLAYPRVVDAVVFSVKDPYLGERICAYVMTDCRQVKASTLKTWMRDRDIALFKIPDLIEVVDTFTYTAVGKVNRKQLREYCKENFHKS